MENMNQSQINKIKIIVSNYFELDINQTLSDSYPNINETESVIQDYSCKEYLSLVNKVFYQFQQELLDPFFKTLPHQYHFNNEFGAGDLHGDLSGLYTQIKTGNFSSSIKFLHRLVHYQAINGFWEKSKRKYFRQSEESVNNEKERILLVSSLLDKNSQILDELYKNLQVKQEELDDLVESRRSELDEIDSLLPTAQGNTAEISELNSDSRTALNDINDVFSQSVETRDKTKELYEAVLDEYNNIQKTLKAQSDRVDQQNEIFDDLKNSFTEKLTFVESKTSSFEERNQYLSDLIGREVGASLFETFKQRKNELKSSIQLWTRLVPLTTIVTILWIYFLFGNGDLATLEWQVILVNSLKALPAIGLLLFTVAQYTKERNFQEEYAFKSAVALTINAYAEQLSADDNKDQLIMESVTKIYNSPIPSINTKGDTKNLADTAKDLSNVAKSLIDNK